MRQEDDAAEREAAHPDRRFIIDALTRLSATQRAVIVCSFYMKQTTMQIAAELNMTDIMAKARLHDVVRALARARVTGNHG